MIAWALENDLGMDADKDARAVSEAGLRVGSADATICIWIELPNRSSH